MEPALRVGRSVSDNGTSEAIDSDEEEVDLEVIHVLSMFIFSTRLDI